MSEPGEHLKKSIAEGKHWYIALLEAIGLWQLKEEIYNDRHYHYLIGEEAFDWLLLADRLCDEAGDLIPEEEKTDLLFGKPPLEISKEKYKEFVGNAKYRAYLNYFYGITVEQALHLAIQLETEKEMHGHIQRGKPQDSVFMRIYGSSESDLVAKFRDEKGLPQSDSITLTEVNEFTYWLFKYRFNNSDSARVASDTKKALQLLEDSQGDHLAFR